MFSCALCNDSDIQDGAVVGDPTEGALYVLAQKGGVDVKAFRQNHPRIASVPFDSDYKFMATFHEMTGADGTPVVRAYVKGAPDVILDRSTVGRMPGGGQRPLTDEMRGEGARRERAHRRPGPARPGLRPARVRPGHLRPVRRPDGPDADLELTALVGEVDPPREEARTAIAAAKGAGIRVRMITGDHAVTAAAIARSWASRAAP